MPEETASCPAMSGLTRPSSVGPCEEYGSSESGCQQIAPAVNAAVDAAGAVMLPAATEYCALNTPLLVNRSMRGVPVPAKRLMKTLNVAVAPVLAKHTCSTGRCVPVCAPSLLATTVAVESVM